jgi:streptogramin lyase
MDMLDDGDLLYVNDFGELRRVTPDPQSTVVASGLSSPYGITVGPDQQAYVCRSSGIYRVDPDTGDYELWTSLPGGGNTRAMVFNLDSTGAYIATLIFGNSPVYFVEVDEDLDPVGPPVIFATNVGQGYHDGLGIDACGNLYVPDFNTAGLYRVDPDGVVTTLYNEGTTSLQHYGHGLEWGSGIDGWNDKAIYLPQPYDGDTVNEIVLGVPSGSVVRTWR